ncbi:MAG: hypothetical protein OSJ38_11505 [Lachnospiraceae bacterium]|nr:hypothetical protein [Lachnospiraceae bacterium]
MLSKNPMVNATQAAQKAARKAIEATYFGSLSVTEQKKVKDEKSKLTKTESVIVLENQPCKLSFETVKVAAASDTAATVTQITKLFVSPDISIKPGSKITVTQDGITENYTHSGVPARYPTHQEIMLELFERWA